jgi:hypothetical protein
MDSKSREIIIEATRKGGKRKGARRRSSRGSSTNLPPNMMNSQFNMPVSVTFPSTIIGFPDRLTTILRYSESYTFTGSAAPTGQYWQMNSAFDVNGSGTGHQPSFYDTFTAIYSRYFVKEFKIEVMVNNHTSTVGVFGVLAYGDINASGNTVEQLSEAKYAKSFVLGQSTGGGNVKTISLPWMASSKLMGTPYTEADDNMYAAWNANPNDLGFAWLKVAADDATTAISVLARCVIHQRVVFKDLLTQVTS